MGAISEMALNGLGNAVWQIAAIVLVASICARVLQIAAPAYRHLLWVATLALSLALPLLGLINFEKDAQFEIAEPSAPSVIQERASLPSPATSAAPSVSTIDDPETGATQSAGLLQMLRRPIVTSSTLALWLVVAYALFLTYRFAALIHAFTRAQAFRRSAYKRELPTLLVSVGGRCQKALGLKHIPLLFSGSATTPATVGVLNPVIVLPEYLLESNSEETLATMVGHEMAHIARRDYALNLLYEFLFLPISFHPLAILVKRQIARTRELACDDMVAGTLLEPHAYARSLVRVAGASILPAAQPLTLGVFDADILEERIMKLTQDRGEAGTRSGRLLALCAFSLLSLICVAVSGFSFELRIDGSDLRPSTGALNPLMNETRDEAQSQRPVASPQDPASPPLSRSELTQVFSSANPEVRAEAACRAGRSKTLDAIPHLVAMLGDDAPIQPTNCWDGGRWNPALSSFKHPSPGEHAAIALASMGAPAFEPLTNALSDSNSTVRRNAAWAIGELTNMGGKERADAVPRLIALLDDSDEWVRRAAARSLGEIRDERATDGLIAHLSDREWRVRETVAWALGEMKEKTAVEALCRLIQSDQQFEVRKTTAWALAEIQDKSAVESLCRVLQSEGNAEVRSTIAWALGETKDKRAIEILSNVLLTDEDVNVRKNAAWALGEIQSRKALEVLKQALLDPEESVREKVKWALSEIEDSSE